METSDFNQLSALFEKIPAIGERPSHGRYDDGNWWIKFSIDITNALAWNVVQELGCILNYISLEEKLPTVFYPVSAPPYLNGGPEEFLYWVIESKDPAFSPDDLMGWLGARLPDPIDDINEWNAQE